MTTYGWIFALLLGAMLGCSDHATIGGVCLKNCAAAACGRRGCAADGGPGGCSGASCGVDAGDGACPAGDCDSDAGPVCREGSYELTRTRLDLMLIVDASASLAPWWPALYDGLAQFLQDSDSSGIGVGLQLFDEVCDAQHYVDPIVPIAPLPQNWPALEQAIPLFPLASTSTIPALDGVLQYARTWAASHSDARMAVVLLTDAAPGACDALTGDIDGVAQSIARAGYAGTPSIQTYVIGFSLLSTTNAIALAGGTQPALISVTPADGEVRAALDNVRQGAQPCAFKWQSEWTLAPTSAVVVTAADGTKSRYPILGNAAACDQQAGFYVDDPTAPFPLVACARTCRALAATDRLALSSACMAP
jgi:hypothetical protein